MVVTLTTIMVGTHLMDEKIDVFSHAIAGNGYENTCDSFINSLPEAMDMRDVEVGVKQITLPTSWNPIPHTNRNASRLRWILTYNNGLSDFPSWDKMIMGPNTQWVGEGRRSLLFTLNVGLYNTAKDIVEQMKKQIDATFALLTNYPTWIYITL